MTNPLDMTGRRVLVTGASSGIGRDTALLLSTLGATLILVGRDEGRLDASFAVPDRHGASGRSIRFIERPGEFLPGLRASPRPRGLCRDWFIRRG